MSIQFDQTFFLFLCLQHSGGKIDFAAVARDYQKRYNSPLSKDAASKRFIRLKAKIVQIGSDDGTTGSKKRVNKEGLFEEKGALKKGPLKEVKKKDSGNDQCVKVERQVRKDEAESENPLNFVKTE
jgi:hypothetical protein